MLYFLVFKHDIMMRWFYPCRSFKHRRSQIRSHI